MSCSECFCDVSVNFNVMFVLFCNLPDLQTWLVVGGELDE